jgi:NADPH:quinone reductase-like Zn-dependent oxidoreductase
VGIDIVTSEDFIVKAYELQNDFGFDNVEIVDREEPEPGEEEVLVDIHATSINYRDLMMIRGAYNPNQALPLVPFCDASGEVVDAGSGVERFEVGDRVAPIFAQEWRDGDILWEMRKSTLGGPLDGTLAEKRVFNEEGLVSVPDHLTDEEAATLTCAGVTAWKALNSGDSLKAGETVLLLGTGGVSMFSLQFAKTMGANVIMTSSSDEKLEEVRKMGVDETINYESTPNWDEAVMELTDGVGADRIVEVGGAGTLQKSLDAAGLEGHVSIIGVLSGVSGDLAVTSALMKGLTMQGILVGSRRDFENMNRAIDQNELRPFVDRVFGFDEAVEACRYQEAGKHMGKVVVRCSD